MQTGKKKLIKKCTDANWLKMSVITKPPALFGRHFIHDSPKPHFNCEPGQHLKILDDLLVLESGERESEQEKEVLFQQDTTYDHCIQHVFDIKSGADGAAREQLMK